MRRFLPLLALLAVAVFVAAWFEGRRPAPARLPPSPGFPSERPAEAALAVPVAREATPGVQLDGGEVRLVDGRPAVRGELWFDELSAEGTLVRERSATIRDGRYRIDGTRALRWLPRSAVLQGAPALVVAPLAPLEPGAAPPLVELRLLEAWRLRVVAAEDGVDLEGVEVLGLQSRDADGLILPRRRYGVARDAASPVVLPDPARRLWDEPLTAWVRAPGRAWGRIDLVRGAAAPAMLSLEPACSLVVDARALAASAGELVVSRIVEGRAQVVARAAWADEVAFEGLAPGEYSIETTHPGVAEPLRATLAPGVDSRAACKAASGFARRGPAVALKGELRLHPSWMDKSRSFAFALAGGGRHDRAPLGAAELKADGWSASFDLLVPEGAHDLLVDELWPAARVAAPSVGVRLELAPRVLASFVGAEQATLELRPADGPHDWRAATPGAASLDLPEGEWSLRSAAGSRVALAERRVSLVAPEATIVLDAAPRGIVRATLSQAGRARPFESHWQAWIVDEAGGALARLEPDARDGWMSAMAVAPEGRRLAIASFMVDGRATEVVRIEPLDAGEARTVRIEAPR
jgi:hypothetical protein